jgi:adenosylmethionine-8-amino-7-oxononanoate aminotransferase
LRGAGAVWGLGMTAEMSALDVRDAMLARGVIPRPIATHTVAFCPPLVISDDEIDEIVAATTGAVEAVAARKG